MKIQNVQAFVHDVRGETISRLFMTKTFLYPSFIYEIMTQYTSIQEAMHKGSGKVSVRGWIHRERGSNKFKFVVLRDSSNILQCIFEREKFAKQWEEIDHLQVEASLEVSGQIKKDDRAPTGYEIQVESYTLVGPSESYPIGKDQSVEFLADNRHLWLRSQKMIAILKIRSTVFNAIH